MTTVGFTSQDFKDIGLIIVKALKKEVELTKLKDQVLAITSKYNFYG